MEKRSLDELKRILSEDAPRKYLRTQQEKLILGRKILDLLKSEGVCVSTALDVLDYARAQMMYHAVLIQSEADDQRSPAGNSDESFSGNSGS